ncbi:MAG: glycosyltransferase family 4 protein [Candidatus Eisenbacteria sp.]|nr:glycosyltransferase family 4 protein [Candidatus Eisenbacteria bacterium]
MPSRASTKCSIRKWQAGSGRVCEQRGRDLKVCQICAVDISHKILLAALNKSIVTAGHDLVLVSSPGPHFDTLKAEGYRVVSINIARNQNFFSHMKSVTELYRFMRRESFDLVHVHTPVAALLGRIAARLARVPLVVYTAHGFYFHENMPAPQRAFHQGLEKWAGRMTDFLFTQSAEDAATARDLKLLPADRILAIGNGVELRRFDPHCAGHRRQETRRELGLPDSARVILSMGRLVREKGYGELFQALSKMKADALPDHHLLVVGSRLDSDRDDGLRAEIRRVEQDSDLKRRVHFLGQQEDIAGLLSASDIFVLPSHREGMPRSIIEAMASGLPVVATDIRGCREEVVAGTTGLLVPVGDVDALAAALAELVSDPEKARAMGAAGRQRAQALYDESAVVARQLEVYQQLHETAC